MPEVRGAAARILAAQQSLITTRQAASVGIDRERCRSLAHQRIWERIDHGVYGPLGVPLTWKRQLMAALMLAPAGSLGSHRAAATVLGVGGIPDVPEPVPEITIPRGTTFRRPWLVVHESTDLALADRRRIDGIPVTGPRRLAMDLGSVVSEKRYRQTMRELRARHGVGFGSRSPAAPATASIWPSRAGWSPSRSTGPSTRSARRRKPTRAGTQRSRRSDGRSSASGRRPSPPISPGRSRFSCMGQPSPDSSTKFAATARPRGRTR